LCAGFGGELKPQEHSVQKPLHNHAANTLIFSTGPRLAIRAWVLHLMHKAKTFMGD
jgi:hypothetical protein